MPLNGTVPVLGRAGQAYALLWRQRLLHAMAIWPPVLFLVTAEFLYHRVVGNADGLAGRWHAVARAPWFMTAGAAVAWLAGLKFLLSFSLSWRRHLLLGERFDPFFFKAPFWRYLGFLLLTYAWIVPVVLLSQVPAGLLAAAHARAGAGLAALACGVPAVALVIWAIARQVPVFTTLALGRSQPTWREGTRAMRGNALGYIASFALAMLPVAALNLALDLGLGLAGVDPHAVSVALAESVFRQAMLFVHVSLGASIGATTTAAVLPQLRVRVRDRQDA